MNGDQLKRLGIDAMWVEPLNTTFAKFGILTPKEQACFIGQASHESGHFRMLEENLNYKAETLMKLWPKRFPTMEEANKYARQPQLIANHIYCNRMGNRDEASGDGFRFRGGGLFQLTGHDNYWHCGQALGVDLVMQPELVRQPLHAALSAGWFWQTHKCGTLVDNQEQLCKRINGGLIGLDDRVKQTQQALSVLN
jgi:putative chitinase